MTYVERKMIRSKEGEQPLPKMLIPPKKARWLGKVSLLILLLGKERGCAAIALSSRRIPKGIISMGFYFPLHEERRVTKGEESRNKTISHSKQFTKEDSDMNLVSIHPSTF